MADRFDQKKVIVLELLAAPPLSAIMPLAKGFTPFLFLIALAMVGFHLNTPATNALFIDFLPRKE